VLIVVDNTTRYEVDHAPESQLSYVKASFEKLKGLVKFNQK
jgi:hypothetical protein